MRGLMARDETMAQATASTKPLTSVEPLTGLTESQAAYQDDQRIILVIAMARSNR